MGNDPHMISVTTVRGSFHGKVVAARLAAEGVPSLLRGGADGPYPLLTDVDVLVPEALAPLAREILLADAVDAAFLELEQRQEQEQMPPRRRSRGLRRGR